jgi:hypothetical protein
MSLNKLAVAMKITAMIFAWLILMSHTGFSQTPARSPKKYSKGKEPFPIENFLRKMRTPLELMVCGKRRAVVAIKFKLNARGEVIRAETIGNLEDSTKRYLSDLFFATRGRWKSYQGKPVANKWLVLPIRFIIKEEENILRRDKGDQSYKCDEQAAEISSLEASMVKVFDLITNNQDYIILELCTNYRYYGPPQH